MFTHRSFYLLLVVALMIVTACAPQAVVTSTATSMPVATLTPLSPTIAPTSTLEALPLEFKGHTSDVWGVDFSPDGKYLATGSSDKTARLWDVATGETLRTFSGHTGEIDGVEFSPDGKYLLTGGGADHTARLWDVASGETVQIFSGHTGSVDDGAFSPDGKLIVTAGGEDLTARIWDVATGETLHVLAGHSGGYLPRVAFSPDGKYVLTAGGDSARVWDVTTGEQVQIFPDDQYKGFSAVAFSPDSKFVATGSDDHIARVWEIATGELVREFSGHQGFVNGIAFSPDGRFLLTGSADRTVRLWNVETGETIHIFEGHRADVQGVAFSPDSNLIATGSNDGIARVWNLQASLAAKPPQTEPGTITLRLAVSDGGGRPSEPYVLEFIEQVKTISNGNITIEPIWQAGDDTSVGSESGVIEHVMRGDMELGLAGSRAFDTEGIKSFQALQAPYVIDNDALSKAVATSDIATRMLDSLSSAGIVGLTMWPEDLRHPFSLMPGKPILAPEDFAGLNVRAIPSGVTYMLIETFGGSPMLADYNYQGAESGLRQGASLTGTPTATGNVVFFAKFQVLFANGAAFEKFSEEQRAILREAAAATQKKAIAEHPSEVDAAKAWCADGGTVVLASEEQVAAFEVAAQPVFDMIAQDPLNAELIAAIRELKANTEPSPGAEACTP
jgi:WD40 repeat protein